MGGANKNAPPIPFKEQNMKINIEIKKDKIIYNKQEISMTEFLVLMDCLLNNKTTGNTKFNVELTPNGVYKDFKAE